MQPRSPVQLRTLGQEEDQAAATILGRSSGRRRGHSFLLTSRLSPQERSLDLNTVTTTCTNFCWSIYSLTATASTRREKELISAAPEVGRNRPEKTRLEYNNIMTRLAIKAA